MNGLGEPDMIYLIENQIDLVQLDRDPEGAFGKRSAGRVCGKTITMQLSIRIAKMEKMKLPKRSESYSKKAFRSRSRRA